MTVMVIGIYGQRRKKYTHISYMRKKYSIWLHIKNTFYSQHGVEIHSCSENYGQGIFKTELHKYL